MRANQSPKPRRTAGPLALALDHRGSRPMPDLMTRATRAHAVAMLLAEFTKKRLDAPISPADGEAIAAAAALLAELAGSAVEQVLEQAGRGHRGH